MPGVHSIPQAFNFSIFSSQIHQNSSVMSRFTEIQYQEVISDFHLTSEAFSKLPQFSLIPELFEFFSDLFTSLPFQFLLFRIFRITFVIRFNGSSILTISALFFQPANLLLSTVIASVRIGEAVIAYLEISDVSIIYSHSPH
jgi:hypothetical protein